MYDREKIVEEFRIQKVEDKTATFKTTKRSLSNTDYKIIYVNIIESYPLDENLHLFKGSLININKAASLDQFKKLGLEVSKIIINNIKK